MRIEKELSPLYNNTSSPLLQKVLQRSQDNVGLKLRIDQALDSHGTEKSELIRERNELLDKVNSTLSKLTTPNKV